MRVKYGSNIFLFKNRTKTIFLSSKHAHLPLNMSTLMNCRNVKSVELLFCVSNYEGLLLSPSMYKPPKPVMHKNHLLNRPSKINISPPGACTWKIALQKKRKAKQKC